MLALAGRPYRGSWALAAIRGADMKIYRRNPRQTKVKPDVRSQKAAEKAAEEAQER